MNMFIQFILLPLLLSQFSCISASRYGAYCSSDSDCDQHQKCLNQACRCNTDERRFWTGEICAVCVIGFTATYDRCYQSFDDLKTWADARAYCRARYADLFTWRNNNDEQFIRPVIQTWAASSFFKMFAIVPARIVAAAHPYLAWAGATVTSVDPFTTQWMDPDGIKLDSYSSEWCDPTRDAGYTAQREPSSQSRTTTNGTEREECVTYNFGSVSESLLCLADDYCSQKYPFLCEMNAASMKLANSVLHGDDSEDINFEESPPPPPPPSPTDSGNSDSSGDSGTNQLSPGYEKDPGDTNLPSALSGKSDSSSNTNMVIFIGVAIILIVGAIAGYMFIKKKKQTTDDQIVRTEEVSQNRPSFTSSVGSMMDE